MNIAIIYTRVWRLFGHPVRLRRISPRRLSTKRRTDPTIGYLRRDDGGGPNMNEYSFSKIPLLGSAVSIRSATA